MAKVRIRISGGQARTIYQPGVDLAALGFGPAVRASEVETIKSGPVAGRWCVDFSLLADFTGDDTYRVCLTQTFPPSGRDDAIAAEVAYLKEHWA